MPNSNQTSKPSPGKGNRYEDSNVERHHGPSDPDQQELDQQLDQALKDTFPASDPVQLTQKSQDK